MSGRFGDALDRLKDRLADPVGDRVVESLRVAREVGGGDLGRLLRSLSGFLRDDARTRSELESRQAWTVNGARLAVAAPWLVLLLMCFQPEVIHRYSTGAGRRGAGRRSDAVRVRLPRDGAHRPAARPSGGSSRDPVRRWPCSAPRSGSGVLAGGDRRRSTRVVRRSRCGCCPTSATCLARTRCRRRSSSSNAFAGVFGPGSRGRRPGRRAGARRRGVRPTPAAAGRPGDGRRAVPRRAGRLGTGRVRDRGGPLGAGRGVLAGALGAVADLLR